MPVVATKGLRPLFALVSVVALFPTAAGSAEANPAGGTGRRALCVGRSAALVGRIQ